MEPSPLKDEIVYPRDGDGLSQASHTNPDSTASTTCCRWELSLQAIGLVFPFNGIFIYNTCAPGNIAIEACFSLFNLESFLALPSTR